VILREPAGQRYWFWATWSGGGGQPYRVDYQITGRESGTYWRQPGDACRALYRYDWRAHERGDFPVGSVLGARGRWRSSEAPKRNVWLGSDYGDPITTAQATAIVIEFGCAPDILTAAIS
jgi:hypothetical protein